MHVLFIVLNDPHKIRDVLVAMRKKGIKGATVIDSIGSGKLSDSAHDGGPKVGGLMSYLQSGIIDNKTIFSVLENIEKVEEVADAVEDALGGTMNELGKGIMFSFPVDMVRGGKISVDTDEKK